MERSTLGPMRVDPRDRLSKGNENGSSSQESHYQDAERASAKLATLAVPEREAGRSAKTDARGTGLPVPQLEVLGSTTVVENVVCQVCGEVGSQEWDGCVGVTKCLRMLEWCSRPKVTRLKFLFCVVYGTVVWVTQRV